MSDDCLGSTILLSGLTICGSSDSIFRLFRSYLCTQDYCIQGLHRFQTSPKLKTTKGLICRGSLGELAWAPVGPSGCCPAESGAICDHPGGSAHSGREGGPRKCGVTYRGRGDIWVLNAMRGRTNLEEKISPHPPRFGPIQTEDSRPGAGVQGPTGVVRRIYWTCWIRSTTC